MADPDLENLRQQRLAQLQSQYKGGDGADNSKAREEQAKAQQEAKYSILAQVLDQSARARLNTLMMAKPDKAQMVETMLIRMAQSGQISGKIGESDFINILESVNQQIGNTKTTVKFDRRRAALDSDDDDL